MKDEPKQKEEEKKRAKKRCAQIEKILIKKGYCK